MGSGKMRIDDPGIFKYRYSLSGVVFHDPELPYQGRELDPDFVPPPPEPNPTTRIWAIEPSGSQTLLFDLQGMSDE